MTDFQNLSEADLLSVIEKAETALKNKQANKRKEVIAKIKELAASIDMAVELRELDRKVNRTVSKVAIKYRHPKDPEKVWTGRGMTPKWMQELISSGHNRDEFKLK